MPSKTRSAAVRESWKHRKAKGVCAFCHRKVWVRGLKRNGRLYHNECWDRERIIGIRKASATRGFYKE